MSTPNTPSYYLLPDGRDIADITGDMRSFPSQALKYLKRAGLKQGEPMVKDLRKALDYLERELKLDSSVTTKLVKDYQQIALWIAKEKPLSQDLQMVYYAISTNIFLADELPYKKYFLTNAIDFLKKLINSLEAQNE